MAYLATGQDDKASNEFSKARTLAPKDTELGAKIDAALKSRPEKAKGLSGPDRFSAYRCAGTDQAAKEANRPRGP